MKTKEADNRKDRWYRFRVNDNYSLREMNRVQKFFSELYISDSFLFFEIMKMLVDIAQSPELYCETRADNKSHSEVTDEDMEIFVDRKGQSRR